MNTKSLFLILVASCLALFLTFTTGSAAQAETLVYSDTAPFGNLGDGVEVVLPKWDPAFGILTNVQITMSAYVSITAGFQNRDGGQATIRFNVSVDNSLLLPDSDIIRDARVIISRTEVVSGDSNPLGPTDFTAPSARIYTYTNVLQSSKAYVIQNNLAPYAGPDNFVAVFIIDGTSTARGSTRIDSFVRTDGFVIAEVQYIYAIPQVELEKLTNNRIADNPEDPDVPQIKPGDPVTWTYLVTNTGPISIPLVTLTTQQVGTTTVPIPITTITVTDSQTDVIPVRDPSSDLGGDQILAPGERWIYRAFGTAANLLAPSAIITTVPGCTPPDANVPGARTTYRNIGAVVVPGNRAEDPSHYCNPPLPAIDLTKYTNGEDANTPTGPIIPLGGPVTWTYLITNTGNTPLTNLALVDNRIGAITCPSVDLAIGATMLCSATGTATAGQYANIGTVTATVPPAWPPTPPVTATNPSHYFGHGFDLALRKTLASGQSVEVKRNQLVKFTITIFNQGTITATNIQLFDHYPPGFTLADANWVDQGLFATRLLPGPLTPGQSTSVEITLRVPQTPVPGLYTNTAEIGAANDHNSQAGDDYDSLPDGNVANDGTIKNDVIDEHRRQNDAADEDDHDSEAVRITDYADLALRKTLATGQATVVKQGDLVKFVITVFNQGTLTARDIEITDYIPATFELADNGWQAVANSSAKRLITGPLASGASIAIEITLRLRPGVTAQEHFNYAEISQMLGTNGLPLVDEDSTPDADSSNDGAVKNDEIGEDRKANPAADEDDHDLESIRTRDVHDLALRLTLAAGQSTLVRPNDLVNYVITIYNQGTLPATDIEVTNYLPPGLQRVDLIGVNRLTHQIAGSLAAGSFITIPLTLRVAVDAQGLSLTDFAEISQMYGPNHESVVDEDSIPDTVDDNDGTPKNDVINEDRKSNPANDEDDHDPETLALAPYLDLALRKTLSPGQSVDVKRNDLVRFTITVFNQGTITATTIRLFDTYPPGFILADANWTDSGSYGTRLLPNALPPGQSTSVEIILRVPSSPAVKTYLNTAEIGSANNTSGQPLSDVDSAPDDDETNDGSIKNDVIDEHRLQDPDADEDDHDIEAVRVGEYADLALRKVLAAGQSAEVYRGDLVTFTITIFNQGSRAASAIEIVEYIPLGLELADASWQAGLDNTAKRTIAGPLAAGSSISVNLILRVPVNAIPQSYTNFAEISQMLGADGQSLHDEDSTPDRDRSNDGIVKNDEINQDHKADPTVDEDDHDLEPIRVRDFFDLALRKTLAVGQSALVRPGSRVQFVLTVYNQGTITATNVEISEYIPVGFRLDDINWQRISSSLAKRQIPTPIPPGSFVATSIFLRVEEGITIRTLLNVAEISSATGPTQAPISDEDSTPDATASNDGIPKNDVIYEDHLANPNEDEDDHDVEPVSIQLPTALEEATEPDSNGETTMSYSVFMPIVLR